MKWKESSPAGGHQQANGAPKRMQLTLPSIQRLTSFRISRRVHFRIAVIAALYMAASIIFPLTMPRDASANSSTGRGVMLYGTHCPDGQGPSVSDIQDWIIDEGVTVIRDYMTSTACTDPSDLIPVLAPNGPVTTVVLNAGQKLFDLDWHHVKDRFERLNGVFYQGQFWSYAQVYDEFSSSVDFFIEFGNEPDYYYDQGSEANPAPASEGWGYRHNAISTFKRVNDNACGDMSQPWSQKYPGLGWALAMPAENYDYMLNILQWQPFQGNDPGCNDDLGAGGVRDYFDVMAPHLYGGNNLGDGAAPGDQADIFVYLRSDQFTDAIILTEVGIDNGGGWLNKCTSNFQNNVQSMFDPYPKVLGYSWFYTGNTGNQAWINSYLIDSQAKMAACAGDSW